MTEPSYTELSTDTINLSGTRVPWVVKCFGRTIIGSAQDRPVQVINGEAYFTSVKEPWYGSGEGAYELTATEVTEGTGHLMTGNIKVREGFYRETTDEYSYIGMAEESLALGSTAKSVSVSSNCVALGTEVGITHRVFYVNYVDKLGTYYEAAKIPYTGGTDTVTINVSSSEIIKNRPLESQRQTSVYPAVGTAEFFKGRVFGAVLEPKDYLEGTAITFTEGSSIITITGDVFLEADRYKGITNRDTNEIVAFIEQVVSFTTATIRLPNDSRDISTWRDDTVTLDNVGLSGDLTTIYASPIYAGGAGGGIIQGILTWNPLDQLKDEGFHASGARVCRLKTIGDALAVIYDKGIGIFEGEMSAGAPPNLRHYVAAKNVGAFNPDAVWETKDGSLWFQGGGRIYTVMDNQVVDMSARAGVAGFWRKWVEANIYSQHLFQTAYNPDKNMALMVNVPKKGEGTGELGTFAIAICHDTQTVHALRWPVSIKAIHCGQYDNGVWQFHGGADGRTDGTADIYKLLVRLTQTDDYVEPDGDTVTAQPVPGYYTTGSFAPGGDIQLEDLQFLIETQATEDIALTVSVDAKQGNLINGTFGAGEAVTHVIPYNELKNTERYPGRKVKGRALQYKVAFNATKDFTLVNMKVGETYHRPRGVE